ncbi:MAG: hypothetical protein HY904_23015 [Deltaproteobacteria bacterium]|nr:hypothetical protein [Deltaproteobacteria bacterium]
MRPAALMLLVGAGCQPAPGGGPQLVTAAAIQRALTSADEAWLGYAVDPPDDAEIRRQVDLAVDLRWRRDADVWLDQKEPGEQYFHAIRDQGALDRVGLGPEALFVLGDDLFELSFRPEHGLGNGLGGRDGMLAGPHAAPNARRVHQGEFGGPDALGCSECHFKGGLNGAGHATQNAFLRGDGRRTRSADVRNPPHLLGLGAVQRLAQEMTADLVAQRDAAVAAGAARTYALTSKGVSFGSISVAADGMVDTAGVRGVDADLVVKPFGWKGHSPTLRAMAEESFRIHLGILSVRAEQALQRGDLPAALYGDGDAYDADRDGVSLELDDGMLTTMVFYLAQLEVPVIRIPQDTGLAIAHARGRNVLSEVGCTGCHVPSLELRNPVLEVRPEADPWRGLSPPLFVDVARDGERPKVEPTSASLTPTYNVTLFSDLRRHDMGEALASPGPQGNIPATVFLTRPLWGLADTAPFLHDGRATTVDEAIRLHGGEAAASRDAYNALPDEERRALRVFLLSLTRSDRALVP